jgi:hypothetical protein
MVENQAIARVLRLGQTRNVRVVRYVMKETIEEVRASDTIRMNIALTYTRKSYALNRSRSLSLRRWAGKRVLRAFGRSVLCKKEHYDLNR